MTSKAVTKCGPGPHYNVTPTEASERLSRVVGLCSPKGRESCWRRTHTNIWLRVWVCAVPGAWVMFKSTTSPEHFAKSWVCAILKGSGHAYENYSAEQFGLRVWICCSPKGLGHAVLTWTFGPADCCTDWKKPTASWGFRLPTLLPSHSTQSMASGCLQASANISSSHWHIGRIVVSRLTLCRTQNREDTKYM